MKYSASVRPKDAVKPFMQQPEYRKRIIKISRHQTSSKSVRSELNRRHLEFLVTCLQHSEYGHMVSVQRLKRSKQEVPPAEAGSRLPRKENGK